MARRSAALDALLARAPQLWRGREPNRGQRSLPSGHARLDARLPGGGWPIGAVTELIHANPGLGEFSLLFPALAALGRNGEWLILVDPPWIPYPAALHGHGLLLERLLLVRTGNAQESLWACEQALAANRGGAVLAWPELAWPDLANRKPVGFARLRRLQLAAEAGAKPAFLFRPHNALAAASPAALRLHLSGPGEPSQHGMRIDILKCRGNRPHDPVWLAPRHPGADPSSLVGQPEPEQTAPLAGAALPHHPAPFPPAIH